MNTVTGKVCRTCRAFKPLTDFYSNINAPFGKNTYCIPCSRARAAEWKTLNRGHISRRNRELNLKRHGLTESDYEILLTRQGGGCALCGRGRGKRSKLAVDHDHETERIRGLLCVPCNTALGRLGDTPARITRVLSYLSGTLISDVRRES